MFTGILFFPITPFDREGAVDLDAFRAHVERGVSAGAGAVFVACGTGEFSALTPDEHAELVTAAVDVVRGRVPVLAGAGGAAGLARQFVRGAAAGGADGVLLLPPYLSEARGEALVRYVEAATDPGLPAIVYHRGTARFDEGSAIAVSRLPHVVGLKDGVGDLDLMARIVRAVRDDAADRPFHFFNGLPTAEVTQRAYRAIGVPSYSSAVFAFAPGIALAYRSALESEDTTVTDALDREFFHPFVRLRSRANGYAVSLVKAGVELAGFPAGAPRPPSPLVDPLDLADLESLIRRGRAALDQLTMASTT